MDGDAAQLVPRYRDVLLPRAGCPSGQADSWLWSEHEAFNPADPNTALIATVVVGEETPQVRAVCETFDKLIRSEFFNALRTTESIGYVVSSSSQRVGYGSFLRFIVQSAVASMDASYLLTRVVAFIDYVESSLMPSWTPEQLEEVKQALIRSRLDQPKSIREELTRLDEEMLHPSQFQRRRLEIEAIEKIQLQDVKQFFLDKVSNRTCSDSKCRLAVVVRRGGAAPTLENDESIDAAHQAASCCCFTTKPLVRQDDQISPNIKLSTFLDESERRSIQLTRFTREMHAFAQGTRLRHRSF